MKAVVLFCAAIMVGFAGCVYAQKGVSHKAKGIVDFRQAMRTAFLDECKKVAVGEAYRSDARWKYNGKFEIVYLNEEYMSFREDTWINSKDFAHGGTSYTVGTMGRKTGKVLKASDLIAESRRAEVIKALREGVLKEIGEGSLLNDPYLTDNCYVGEDDIHFIYNEYQIAPFCLGPIEVILQVPNNQSKSVFVSKVITNSIYE